MIPYGKQTIDRKDTKRVVQTLRSPWLTQGPAVLEFEKALANICGAKYAVAVSSGTAALHLAYLATGLKKGDEVITTPNTFAATSNMLLAVGAKPVFCDIRLDTYNIDETKIERLIGKKTKAIACVDFAGQPCEYDAISRIAKKHKLILIADASHSLGAAYQSRPIGSLADLTTFSFHPVKAIATGEGGAVLTDNKKLYEKVKLLRSHGIYKNKQGKNVMIELGYNYRLTDIQAALGVSQLRKLKSFMAKRRQVTRWYWEEMKNFDQIILPNSNLSLRGPFAGSQSAWHIYVILVTNPRLRDSLWRYLVRKGIGANFHYPAVYSHPYYRKHGFARLTLPNEEIYQKSCLTLPCYPTLSRKQVRHISQVVKGFFRP